MWLIFNWERIIGRMGLARSSLRRSLGRTAAGRSRAVAEADAVGATALCSARDAHWQAIGSCTSCSPQLDLTLLVLWSVGRWESGPGNRRHRHGRGRRGARWPRLRRGIRRALELRRSAHARLTTLSVCIAAPTAPARDKEGKCPPLTHAPAVPLSPTSWRKMAWFSLLPEHLSSFETWIARLFIFFGMVTIGPWAALIVYDLVLYCFRTVTYELPVVGGRARGKRRPRAPSLTERPSGQRRQFNPMLQSADDDSAHASGTSLPADFDATLLHRNTTRGDT